MKIIRLDKYKFRTQLYLYFIIVISMIVISMWITVYFVVGNDYVKKESGILKTQANQIAININNRLNYYLSYMNLIASDNELLKSLENAGTKEQKRYLDNITKEFKYLNSGKIGSINIYQKEKIDKEKETLLKEVFDFFEKHQKEQYYFTQTYLNNKNEKVFSIFMTISQKNLDRHYLLEFCIYETEIYEFFCENQNGNDIFITNEKGIVSISDRKNFYSILRENSRQNTSGRSEAISISTNGNYGWNVLILTDKEYLNHSMLKVICKMFPLLAGILAITFLLVIMISNKLNKKINILQKKISAVGVGTSDVSGDEITGDDEFKLLSDRIDIVDRRIRQLIKEIEETNKKQRVAEMVALRSQINTHFLFNSLSTIKWMAKFETGKLSEVIDNLSIFLRYAISTEENQVPLKREVEQLEAYIYLQKLKYEDELNIVVDIEDEILQYKTVKLILQPLIENAIFHGWKEDESALNITIYSYYDDLYYYLVVEDDGIGMSQEKIRLVMEEKNKDIKREYGLRNIIKRISLCTGGEGKIFINSELNKYTKIVISQKRQ